MEALPTAPYWSVPMAVIFRVPDVMKETPVFTPLAIGPSRSLTQRTCTPVALPRATRTSACNGVTTPNPMGPEPLFAGCRIVTTGGALVEGAPSQCRIRLLAECCGCSTQKLLGR